MLVWPPLHCDDVVRTSIRGATATARRANTSRADRATNGPASISREGEAGRSSVPAPRRSGRRPNDGIRRPTRTLDLAPRRELRPRAAVDRPGHTVVTVQPSRIQPAANRRRRVQRSSHGNVSAISSRLLWRRHTGLDRSRRRRFKAGAGALEQAGVQSLEYRTLSLVLRRSALLWHDDRRIKIKMAATGEQAFGESACARRSRRAFLGLMPSSPLTLAEPGVGVPVARRSAPLDRRQARRGTTAAWAI